MHNPGQRGSARRPAFHFTAKNGWINDPHGIVWHDGRYEAFFQYVPGSLEWAPNCHWGHAVGEDLMSLNELEPAILPGDGDDGIWTGCLVEDGDEARIFYTSTSLPDLGRGRVRSATPSDGDWTRWRKGAVVAEIPEGLGIVNYRDPFVLRDGDGWRMLVGAGDADGTAMVLSYTSADLDAWVFDGVMLARSARECDPLWTGSLWECPQIFEVGGEHALVFSVWDDDTLHYVAYALGVMSGGRFAVRVWGRLSYGPSYYAPSLFIDSSGAPALTFWIRGVEDRDAGWVGAHSLPHSLSVVGDQLVATPHADLERYRAGVVEDGPSGFRVDGPVDVSWAPEDGDALRLLADGGVAVGVTRRGEALNIVVGDQRWDVPVEGPVRLVLDGPVLELSSAGGIFACPVPAGVETIQADGATPTLWRLGR